MVGGAYVARHGQPLAIAASNGLLALTFSMVSGPSHGSIEIHADGTFRYTPTAGFVGADSFVYRANDGLQDSLTATQWPVHLPPDRHRPAGSRYGYDQRTNEIARAPEMVIVPRAGQ